MGSGGVGGYFGARLQRGGADVTFVARGAHLAAMRANGLAIESEHEPIELPKVNATDDPRSIGPVDMVLLNRTLCFESVLTRGGLRDAADSKSRDDTCLLVRTPHWRFGFAC
jgi:hypothetical protein